MKDMYLLIGIVLAVLAIPAIVIVTGNLITELYGDTYGIVYTVSVIIGLIVLVTREPRSLK